MTQNQIARQRLCLTADKTELVDAGDERAAFLFAAPGDEILPDVAERFGLVDGALPDFADPAMPQPPELVIKERPLPKNKAKPAAETKPATSEETKEAGQ